MSLQECFCTIQNVTVKVRVGQWQICLSLSAFSWHTVDATKKPMGEVVMGWEVWCWRVGFGGSALLVWGSIQVL